MEPAQYDLKIVRGDSFVRVGRLWPQVYDAAARKMVRGPLPLDITGYTFSAQVRADEAAPTVLITLTVTLLDQASDDTRGCFAFALTKTQTATLLPLTATGRDFKKIGVWDLEATQPNGTTDTIYGGDVSVRPDVTR